MVKKEQSNKGHSKKLISLLLIVARYSLALEYDLMTKTAYTLDDLGRSLTWRALFSFVCGLDKTSLLWQQMNGDKKEEALWEKQALIPQLLALLIDEVRNMQYIYASSHSKKPIKQPEPIPRPHIKKNSDTKHYGSKPVTKQQFEKFWSTRKEE